MGSMDKCPDYFYVDQLMQELHLITTISVLLLSLSIQKI